MSAKLLARAALCNELQPAITPCAAPPAVRAVRLLLLSDVGLLLSGAVGWSAVGVLSEPEHTSHTYDTIKRSQGWRGR